jgi:ribonuclease P/MRP protein subunit POP8
MIFDQPASNTYFPTHLQDDSMSRDETQGAEQHQHDASEDQLMQDAEEHPDANALEQLVRSKSRAVIHHTATLRKPQWTYFHLAALSFSSALPTLDILTFRQNLTSALTQFLGLTGAAIDVDILKFEGTEAWIRVHRDDATAVHEAISGWAGAKTISGQYKWTVKGRDEWLTRLVNDDGMDLYKS